MTRSQIKGPEHMARTLDLFVARGGSTAIGNDMNYLL
jgi:hypothetical protein